MEDRPREEGTDQQVLRYLYNQLEQSRDRLCFIRYQEEGASMPRWCLVEVDLDTTDPGTAKKTGNYWCKWWIKNHQDSTKLPTQECRFRPEVRQKGPDGVLGRLLMVRPDRCDCFLE